MIKNHKLQQTQLVTTINCTKKGNLKSNIYHQLRRNKTITKYPLVTFRVQPPINTKITIHIQFQSFIRMKENLYTTKKKKIVLVFTHIKVHYNKPHYNQQEDLNYLKVIITINKNNFVHLTKTICIKVRIHSYIKIKWVLKNQVF